MDISIIFLLISGLKIIKKIALFSILIENNETEHSY